MASWPTVLAQLGIWHARQGKGEGEGEGEGDPDQEMRAS